jgi:hypothetical protein
MQKQTAIKRLGGTPKKAQIAMGYKTIQAIYMWSDPLKPGVAQKVEGVIALLKTRRKSPSAQV